MTTVLFTRNYDMLKDTHINQIESVAPDITVIVEEDVLNVIPDTDILIAGKLDTEVLHKAHKLKWVHALAAGVDRLLFPEFVASDIILTNSSGVHPVPISEHVLGLMLLFTRKLQTSVKNQLHKKWERPHPVELYKKTVGIIGFGSIGERIGSVCMCMGMYVIGIKNNADNTTENAHEIYPPDKLDDLLTRSDFVVVALPLTDATKHYITYKELSLMKNTAYIINISRGKTIDQQDLITALQENIIAGAGLDVFEEEPLPDNSPLWDMDNVIITPHYAGSTPVYFDRAIDIFCENLQKFLNNEPMINVVDKEKGY
jgi:D-2-hydroxyacid dehydrogenase (NADP+)